MTQCNIEYLYDKILNMGEQIYMSKEEQRIYWCSYEEEEEDDWVKCEDLSDMRKYYNLLREIIGYKI